ncbi:MAG: hypothetical protein AB8G15_13575 [Saprospiraceae bacterium]
MKNLNLATKQFLYCLLCLPLLFCQTSCSKDTDGCTIAEATNYNPDANVDDKSCTFHRDAYVGTYGTDRTCSNGMSSPSMRVIALAEDFTSVYLEIEGYSIVEATVNETNLTVPLQNLVWDGTPGYQIEGTAVFEGSILKFTYQITNGALAENVCTIKGVKQ